jgi:hypothetical protein
MNAKKLLSVLVLAGAGLSLVACGAKTVTRDGAITVLDKISTAEKASGFVPTSVKIATTSTADKSAVKTIQADSANVYAHTVYNVDSKNYAGVVVAAAGTEIWAYKDGDNYYAVKKAGDAITSYVASDAVWSAAITAAIEAKFADATESAPKMSAYLKGFNSLDSKGSLVTGATDLSKSSVTMKAESYTSSGDANVTLDITPHYASHGEYDEHMVYKYNANLIQSIQNDKYASLVTYSWKASVKADKPASTGTVVTVVEGAAIWALL